MSVELTVQLQDFTAQRLDQKFMYLGDKQFDGFSTFQTHNLLIPQSIV